ncbi:response regulator transcription factor [Arenibacter sp. 6A1]|uniref:LytR/AlgR family response regulator transcription factor n=1 Tax=Arenibacter sp. 6A1 TaxID=2720391 RepID=UPI0014486D28|nr:LytTR family DNA-binding domain-containing protein [Arenibacter sp. 6A1]NKI26996.1 response regulator transcription factor [Arenibacter sp. 6A1]
MKVAIIEDEELAANYLKGVLLRQQLIPIREVVSMGSVKEAIAYFKDAMPDLVFMDIHLEDGTSLEILEAVTITAPIIFTTAYDEYALKAFKHFTIDYLLKPFDEDALIEALEKFTVIKEKYQEEETKNLVSQALNHLKNTYQQRFLVQQGHQLISITTQETAFFYAEGKHLFLYAQNGENYIYNSTIKEVITKLDPTLFFRINRNYIVNIDSVKRIIKHSNLKLEVVLSPTIPQMDKIILSKTEIKSFKQWLDF